MNTRKRLLKVQKVNPCNLRRDKIKVLNYEIKVFYSGQKKKRVRKGVLPGNSKSLWDAVKIAKDLNVETIPKTMFRDNTEVQGLKLADSFASFFDHKVKSISENTIVSDTVYNGERKLEAENSMFILIW